MRSTDLLADAFGRIQESVRSTVEGLEAERLNARPETGADPGNSIAWLVWHLTRIEDDHVADVGGHDQVWTEQGWADRFGLPLDETDTGFGHTSEQVDAVRVDGPALLVGYHDAVHARTLDYLRTLDDADLDRVVDERWDPPVTLGVRLVSVVNDAGQHIGQAGYVRGLLR
ncbi:MAG TPA: DUF664 domain-containing protein [Nocardioidaceae bacterium]|jgi:hypothetical protein|nr:DUF664 domain-containing protein [Nocardioidaceae bacterium]